MQITITEKVDGKYPSVQSGKKKYNVTAELLKQFEIGKSYNVVTKDRPVPNKSKPGEFYTFTDIVAIGEVGPTTSNPNPLPGQSNAIAKEDSIKAMSSAKNEAMLRCSALSNSAILVDAYCKIASTQGMFNGMNAKELSDYLRSLKDVILKENCEFLKIEMELQF